MSKETIHCREVQASAAQPPSTFAKQLSVPLLDTGLICHIPAMCSMHMLLSPRFTYSTRPSAPFSCVGSKSPLIPAALKPVAPLMNNGTASALSAATALASAAVCSSFCAKNKINDRRVGGRGREGCGGVRVHEGSSSKPDVALQHQPPSLHEVRLKTFCCRQKPSTGVKYRLQLRSHLDKKRRNNPCLCMTHV